MCNRGTYAFVALIGSINKHLVTKGAIEQFTSLEKRMDAMHPYLDIFVNYLSNLPAVDENELRFIRGQQAERTWLCRFQNSIHKIEPEYNPDGLETWLKTQDAGLQQKAKEFTEKIFDILKANVLNRLQDLYENSWEDNVNDIKKSCLTRLIQLHGDDDDFDLQTLEWTDAIDLSDLKSIIEKNWTATKAEDSSFVPFKKDYAIKVNNVFGTKAEKLAWINDLIKFKKMVDDPKGNKLSPQQVDELEFIYSSLSPA